MNPYGSYENHVGELYNDVGIKIDTFQKDKIKIMQLSLDYNHNNLIKNYQGPIFDRNYFY